MVNLKNDRFLRALRREPVDATPVWIMRQAGRYLPEYRKVRAQAGDFMTLCQTPELACEVTLQPLRRFALDAAIIFSDILTIPDALGLGLYFAEGEGPCFQNPIQTIAAIDKLTIPDITKQLDYVFSAIRLTKKALDGAVPLIGFAGSPWTIATYMVEGGSSKNFTIIKKMLFDEPAALNKLLSLLVECVTLYLEEQIKAGADALMIFDTWGGILSPVAYQLFSLAHMQAIVKKLKLKYPQVPIILFTKNGQQWLELMADTHCDALGLDWTVDIKAARARVGSKVALQGNMDPALLYAKAEVIQEGVKAILADYGVGNGHVFNLGHGITPEVPPEHVQVLVDAVHEFSKPYHAT